MNRLSTHKRAQIVGCLVEGMSIRATVRVTGAAKNTVTKLLVELGEACDRYQDQVLRGLDCERIECDEVWSFCYAKEKNIPEERQDEWGYGDVWTWTALCADTKLVPAWYIGGRHISDGVNFLVDLESRLNKRIQLSTDGHASYREAVSVVFGRNVDYGQIIKEFGRDPEDERRYSPPRCTKAEKKVITGFPEWDRISTSYVERQNLTMRMGMRRFTRLTNGFSKKVQNLEAAVALHFMHYNFARPHKTLANPYPRTPAMAAGVTDHVWTLEEIVELTNYSDAYGSGKAPSPARRAV